jgi:hypothetical protein
MMIPLIVSLGGLYLVVTVVFFRALKNAPAGFEDKDGFHPEEEPVVTESLRLAKTSPAPVTIRVHRRSSRIKPARLTPHARGC